MQKILKSKDLFLYFLILSFVFVTTFSLALTGEIKDKTETLESNEKIETKEFISNPALKEGSKTFPIISAQAALAIDLESMAPLYEKNPDLLLLPASTTKIVTALVAMDFYRDSDILIVNGATNDGTDMGLIEGEKISAGSLLDGLLIKSANDAAEVLAVNYPGGKTEFVSSMNEKAKLFNSENTHFDNPVGFDGASHYSTAKDLVRISIEAMKNPRFASRVRLKEKLVTDKDGVIYHKLITTNKLLGSVEGVLGVKTGWTEEARENLITYFERDNRKIIVALLGSQDRFGETQEVINWIFENYEWQKVSVPQVTNYSP